jgi:predicted RNA-binding Zn ribbon-like protein
VIASPGRSGVTEYSGYVVTDAIVARATGQWFDSSDGQHWWFDSGSLALDFAYTGAMKPRNAHEADDSIERARAVSDGEHLPRPADLADWLADRFAGLDATCTEHDLRDALTLRAAVAALAVAASDGDNPATEDIDVVNVFAATGDIPPVLAGGSRQAGRSRPTARQSLSTIARDAVRLFGPNAGGRIRQCAAEDCSMIYLDSSRGGNRRWCSMQRCGNRAKVRAHRARARQS